MTLALRPQYNGSLPCHVCRGGCSDFGKNPSISQFGGSQIALRRSDGSQISTSISPYPTVLHGYVSAEKWDEAVRLCRFIKVGGQCTGGSTATKEIPPRLEEVTRLALNRSVEDSIQLLLIYCRDSAEHHVRESFREDVTQTVPVPSPWPWT